MSVLCIKKYIFQNKSFRIFQTMTWVKILPVLNRNSILNLHKTLKHFYQLMELPAALVSRDKHSRCNQGRECRQLRESGQDLITSLNEKQVDALDLGLCKICQVNSGLVRVGVRLQCGYERLKHACPLQTTQFNATFHRGVHEPHQRVYSLGRGDLVEVASSQAGQDFTERVSVSDVFQLGGGECVAGVLLEEAGGKALGRNVTDADVQLGDEAYLFIDRLTVKLFLK